MSGNSSQRERNNSFDLIKENQEEIGGSELNLQSATVPMDPDQIYDRMGIKIDPDQFVQVHSFDRYHAILELVHPKIKEHYNEKRYQVLIFDVNY